MQATDTPATGTRRVCAFCGEGIERFDGFGWTHRLSGDPRCRVFATTIEDAA